MMPVLPGELWGSTFMPFTIKHILKCHIGKYREAASMLQLWKPLSHPFCTSQGGVTEYHRVYLFQPKSNNPTHVSQRLAGCVGEHFWHFSCVQTSTTILIASSTDWLEMCVVIIIFKWQSHFKQTRYFLTWSIPYFPQYDPWLWKQVQETCNKQGPHESHDFNHYCFKVTISSVQGCTISYPRGVLGLYHDGGEGGSHCFEALLSLGWYFWGVESRYCCGI